MNSVNNIFKTTVLFIGILGFIGCGGSCCEAPNFSSKGNMPVDTTGFPQKQVITYSDSENPQQPSVTINGGEELITITTCTTIHLYSDINGTDSDENLTYIWKKSDYIISKDSEFEYKFTEKGDYNITLTVTNEQNQTTTDYIIVQVQ